MAKEDKLKKQAAKIAAKQAKLDAKKTAKEARKTRPNQQVNYIHTESVDSDPGGWRDDSAIRDSIYDKPKKAPKPKKPFYKRWWFILICAIIIIAIIVNIFIALEPSISKDFNLGNKSTLAGLEYKYPSGWTKSDKNTSKYAEYVKKHNGDFVGSVDYYYFRNGDKITNADVKDYLVNAKGKNIEYGNKSISGASQCKTVDYTYSKSNNDYAVHGYLIIVDGAIYGVNVTVTDTFKDKEIDTANKIVNGLDLKGFDNKTTFKTLSAVYMGSTKAGVAVYQDSKMAVIAKYSDGTGGNVYGYKLQNPQVLKPDKSYNFKITFQGKSAIMKVTCSTMSASHYKNLCNSYSYSKLAHHSTDVLYGKRIKVTGKVTQVISTGEYLIDASTGYDFGNFIHIKTNGLESKIVEDDTVTVYGTVTGDFTYTTTLNAEKTIPEITAKYISR